MTHKPDNHWNARTLAYNVERAVEEMLDAMTPALSTKQPYASYDTQGSFLRSLGHLEAGLKAHPPSEDGTREPSLDLLVAVARHAVKRVKRAGEAGLRYDRDKDVRIIAGSVVVALGNALAEHLEIRDVGAGP